MAKEISKNNNQPSNAVSALPGINAALVIPSSPNMIKENSDKHEHKVVQETHIVGKKGWT